MMPQTQREKPTPAKVLLLVKALLPVKVSLAQSISFASSAKTNHKHPKHANSESDSDIVILPCQSNSIKSIGQQQA